MKVLIADTLSRKAFDIVNILRRHFSNDHIIYTFDQKSKFFVKSIYTPKYLEPLFMNEQFARQLSDILEKFSDNEVVYIPIEEKTIIKIVKYGEKKNLKYLLPNLVAFNTARNKYLLNNFCETEKINCPNYINLSKFEKNNFQFPIIIKPKTGSGSEGIKIIESKHNLSEIEIDFKNNIVQELIPNSSSVEAGFYLCERGVTKAFYSHKRVRTFPKKGGVTVFSKVTNNDEIFKIGSKVLERLNWSGLVMIEFLYDARDEKYKLIEINPRIWGSFLLSEYCGADFMRSYISLTMGKELFRKKIQEDVYIRWIFPYDIFRLIKDILNPKKFLKDMKKTCYINITYSNIYSSLKLIIFTYFKIEKLKMFLSSCIKRK